MSLRATALFSFCATLSALFPPSVPGLRAADQAVRDPVLSLAEKWRWRAFGPESGVPAGRVSALFQDSEDFLYAAAEGGISRYDLHRWEPTSLPPGFRGGDVTGFFESLGVVFCLTPGALWSVEAGRTLAHFYPQEGLAAGSLVAASGRFGDLFVLDSSLREVSLVRGRALEPFAPGVMLPPGEVLDYKVDAGGAHWLLTKLGLYVLRGDQRRWLEVEDRDLDLPFRDAECLRLISLRVPRAPPELVRQGEASAGVPLRLWGVFRPRGVPERWTIARLDDGVWTALTAQIEAAAAPPLDAVIADREGNSYATCEDGRLFVLNRRVERWRSALDLGVGEAKLVHAGLTDSAGGLWFRRGLGGVAFVDVESRRWRSLPGLPDLPPPRVLALLQSRRGDVWAGTSIGVLRFRRGFGAPGEEAPVPEHCSKVKGVDLRSVTGLAEDEEGGVWVSSDQAFRGAFYFNGSNWVEERTGGFRERFLRRIAADRRRELWFLPDCGPGSTSGPALYRRAELTGGQIAAVEVRGLDPGKSVNDLARSSGDGRDTFWLATEAGLLRCRMEETALRVERRFLASDGLTSDEVWAVAEGADGAIWVCYPSSGHGVTRLASGELRTFDVEDGLAHAKVWSLAVWGRDLWCGTEGGLSRFDGECWYSFPVASAERDSSWVFPIAPVGSPGVGGGLLVGTLAHGIFHFVEDDRNGPQFTSWSVPERVVEGSDLTVRWEARDYKDQTRPEDLKFRSRLDGGAWSAFSSQTTLRRRGLAVGRHRIEVEVRDRDGNANRDDFVQSFEVVGRGPIVPLLTAAAVVGGVLALALAVWAGRKLRRQGAEIRRHRALLGACPGAVFLVGPDGRVEGYNGRLAELLGLAGRPLASVIGRPLDLSVVPDALRLRHAVREALDGKTFTLEVDGIRDGEGLRHTLVVRGAPAQVAARAKRATVWVEDRTEEAAAARQSERERRLRSLQAFAGEVMARFVKPPRPAEPAVGSGGAAAGLPGPSGVRDEPSLEALEIFAGHQQHAMPQPQSSIQLGDLLRSLLGLDGSAGAGVLEAKPQPAVPVDFRLSTFDFRLSTFDFRLSTVDFHLAIGLWSVLGSEPLLRRALAEVLRNAAEAMPAHGRLVVRAANVRLDEASGTLSRGSYVELSVRDEGPGIDPQHLDRVFDPFFSTKKDEGREGLGLAVAYGIVRSLGGDIQIESEPGAGTRVTMWLRAAKG